MLEIGGAERVRIDADGLKYTAVPTKRISSIQVSLLAKIFEQ